MRTLNGLWIYFAVEQIITIVATMELVNLHISTEVKAVNQVSISL